ncbi:MAG TPA: PfkB family carbohydrate kinase, partial [Acidimicrobiales bacterium]|nr:PfkB family carbohydrate kinase [Acidimicrobiales bacterium]
SGINALIAAHPGTVFVVDARSPGALYERAVLKLNAQEAARRLGAHGKTGARTGAGTGAAAPLADDVSEEDVVELAARTARNTTKPVFITRGERGIVAAGTEGVYVVPGVEVTGEIDTVGAGDTVVASVAAVLACGGEIAAAASLANLAASVTVRQLRVTGTASAAELTATLPSVNFVYAPELAEIPERARYFPGTDIELVLAQPAVPRDLPPEQVVFDFDGTLSTLREGWGQVMEDVMARAVLGGAAGGAGAAEHGKVWAAARQLIDRTTGMATIAQMQQLADLVRYFGYVPEEEILDGHGYLAIYSSQLAGMVAGRLAKVAAGQLDQSDFQMKNATVLLEALRSRGARLYIASGSDVNHVKTEAEALGLAGYFDGRIYGSGRDPGYDAKAAVLEEILAGGRVDPRAVVVIGDGPAEMREARKRGVVAVGLCSDERRRFGVNLAKRRRLIRGGATMIVPDFTDVASLLKVLGF